jgi:hypothetical protein
MPSHYRRTDLTIATKRALVILLEDGGAMKQAHYWSGSSGRKIFLQTLISLYDRYLVKIVTESRHRNRQMATLTDVGEYAAKEIQRELAWPALRETPSGISDEAAEFIAEAVS